MVDRSYCRVWAKEKVFKVFLKKGKFVVLIQRVALAKVVLRGKAISRTHQNRYSILKTA